MSRPFFRRALCAAVLAGTLTCQAGAVGTSAVSAVLLEGESGRVLSAQNADEERLIASITKIMTAVVALEHGDVNAPYTVTAEDMAEGSSMYLTPGEELTLEELLYGLMLVSGNDAALAVAHCVAGDEASFVELMNETAARLGMTHTSFANPNGLDAEGHYSSAADMAKLAAYALKKEAFLANHNKLLKLYDGCLGVKTGYTKAAGRTLVSAAERDGMTLVCVTLCDGDDWNDHVSLLDYGFSVCRMETAAPAGRILASVQVRCGSSAQVPLMADRELRYPLMGDERLTVVAETPVSVPAPVVPGQVIGTARAYLDGEEVASVPLVAAAPSARVEFQEENSIFERLFG